MGRILADSRVTLSNVNKALEVYDAIRRPFGIDIVDRSRTAGFLHEFSGLPENVEEEKVSAGDRAEQARGGYLSQVGDSTDTSAGRRVSRG